MASLGAVWIAVIVLGATLAIDALSVSMSIGARMHGSLKAKDYTKAVVWFTVIHAAMLSLGFVLGDSLAMVINGIGPWISFTLLAVVGGVMIRAALREESEEESLLSIPPLTWKTLVPLAFACSIDAVAVGSSLGLSHSLPYVLTVIVVSLITAFFVFVGLKLGKAAGEKWQKPAEVTGGIVLVLIGLKSFI
ncbi:manganese efflux pump MntP [Alloscardovia criceti]|uniref:manganese efflux pump MntP n=1 Tax=Alloscardovia criceti TaxID=356828 RepID=UPI0003AA3FB8|nr:manganese efflux pump [Alloscardovia criceti]